MWECGQTLAALLIAALVGVALMIAVLLVATLMITALRVAALTVCSFEGLGPQILQFESGAKYHFIEWPQVLQV